MAQLRHFAKFYHECCFEHILDFLVAHGWCSLLQKFNDFQVTFGQPWGNLIYLRFYQEGRNFHFHRTLRKIFFTVFPLTSNELSSFRRVTHEEELMAWDQIVNWLDTEVNDKTLMKICLALFKICEKMFPPILSRHTSSNDYTTCIKM